MRIAGCILILFTACVLIVHAQDVSTRSGQGSITVMGESVVYVTPDKIIISFGIETKDQDINIAKDKNAAIMKMAVYVLKIYGVPDKEIQTDNLSIEPRWEDEHSDKGFIGFFVRNTLIVTCRGCITC